jgi:hypothetical protein
VLRKGFARVMTADEIRDALAPPGDDDLAPALLTGPGGAYSRYESEAER